jgi:poly-D-alanine transfer protein DltD
VKFLQKIQAQLLNFEKKEFYKHIGIYFGTVLLLVFGIVYYYLSTVSSLKQALKKVNKNREEVRLLLKQHKATQKHKSTINELLSQEKNFKIKNFFDSIVKQHQLTTKQKKEAEVSEEVLYKQYTEIKLTAQFRQMSTQELCDFLNSIEQKTRVYTKELTITKTKGASLDVSLTIATLRPQSELKTR